MPWRGGRNIGGLGRACVLQVDVRSQPRTCHQPAGLCHEFATPTGIPRPANP
jgi:hypothetical protein